MARYDRIRAQSGECSNNFYAFLLLWTCEPGDRELKERAMWAAWEYRKALITELEYLDTCTHDLEVIRRIFRLRELQTLAIRDFRLLTEDLRTPSKTVA